VVRKKMRQWSLRITAYADRLLDGLNSLQWSDAIKEIQRNWIGKSQGAEIDFVVRGTLKTLKVFTTRPDTIFGATFMVVAPELENLREFCSDGQWSAVQEYANKAKNRSEIDRMADTTKTGVFTGMEAINPFTGEPIPVWVSDYVLANYGTGIIMAVPAHDERDFAFAKTFNLNIIPVIKPANNDLELPLQEAFVAKDGICFNSGFLDGLTVKDAITAAIAKVEKAGWGQAKVNYRLREAGFGRQRYWGEPFPIVYSEDGIPQLVKELPVELPQVESYKPTGNGESPLSAVTNWVNTPQGKRETDTMPGWAGSSWYFLRYTDPNNTQQLASPEALNYWQQVDLYVGGSEHATGHLLYSRFWTKFLFDLGIISWDEPFKRLVNQGMIMGEDGQKMSKRWGNVVNPDDVCAQYGADTLRMYEMFLGPLTDSKPWNTHGIEGVSRFFGKFWRLFYEGEQWAVNQEAPTPEELKILHKTIKKITEDIESMSFNTSVSAFMVATNELGTLKCRKQEVLETLLILMAPFAPHIAEELWHQLGRSSSIHTANWPKYNAQYLVESSFNYPISINGKTRAQITFDLSATEAEIQSAVLENELVVKWMEGKPLKKFILVKGRIVNVVV
jgi:leucyl-tRNA synthetase